jgi:hypothetical protein
MNQFDFEDYMHSIARELASIGHIDNNEAGKRFYRVSSTSNIEEILQNIPNISGLNLAVEDNSDGSLIETGSAFIYNRQICSYFLLKKADINDMDARNKVKAELEEANMDIVSRIRRDYNSDHAFETEIGLRNIEWNSFAFFTFGPVFDGLLGLHCMFTLLHPVKLTYNADKWTPIS